MTRGAVVWWRARCVTHSASTGGGACRRPEDVWHFKNMLRKADNNFVRDVRIPREKVEELKEAVEGALR